MVWPVALLGAAACAFVAVGLPPVALIRFVVWLVIGLALYFAYGFRNSTLRRGTAQQAVQPPNASA
jgi:APA family basic amino acid/polyamine antiporter